MRPQFTGTGHRKFSRGETLTRLESVVENGDVHDCEADEALFDALRENLDDGVELVELETEVNDEAFARTIAAKLDEYMRETGTV